MLETETLTFSRRRVRLLALLVVTGFVLWLARGVIGPFVVAAVLAYAFTPVVSAAQVRTGWPRALVVGVGYGLFLAAVGVLTVIAAERAGSELNDLTSGQQDVVYGALHKLFGDTVVVAGTTYSVKDLAKQLHAALLGLVSSPNDAVHLAERAVEIGLQVVLTLIVTFYFLLDGRRFGQFAIRFLEPDHRVDALRIAGRIHVILGRWLRGQLLLIALVAAALYVVLGPILHVPFALALAILSGVLEIIPLVGPIIAAALAGTVAFGARGSDTTIAVLVVYFVVRQIEDQVVMPIVIGRAVHLHPVVTIFAVLVGLSAWGVLGGLLAVPVAAALNVTLHELYPEETGADLEADAAGPTRPALPALRRPRPLFGRARPSAEPMARRETTEPADRAVAGEPGDPAGPTEPAEPADPARRRRKGGGSGRTARTE
jgi:predicted PurR-regulated permease PerM